MFGLSINCLQYMFSIYIFTAVHHNLNCWGGVLQWLSIYFARWIPIRHKQRPSGCVACCRCQNRNLNLSKNSHSQHFWFHIFFMEKKKKNKTKKTSGFSHVGVWTTAMFFHTVPAPKTISCSLTSLNTDGTITQTHTKEPPTPPPKKSCTVHNVSVISTIAPFFLRGATLQTLWLSRSEGAPTPPQQWADLSSLPHSAGRSAAWQVWRLIL